MFIFVNLTPSEQKSMNAMYGFEKECTSKYNHGIFEDISTLFNALPIGHIINGKVFVVHGGLMSDQTMTLDRVQALNRFGQPPEYGAINDLLWSDPMDQRGLAPSPRGVTNTFGPDVTDRFLANNRLELIIRSHQVQEKGYMVQHSGKCITVFSAPNYMGQMSNKGAVCNITFAPNGALEPIGFVTFDPAPIPMKYPPMKYATFGGFF
jgi:serine/threonine-protein phosphatase 5